MVMAEEFVDRGTGDQVYSLACQLNSLYLTQHGVTLCSERCHTKPKPHPVMRPILAGNQSEATFEMSVP